MILRAASQPDVDVIAKIIGDWRDVTPYIPALHTREQDRQFMQGVVTQQDVTVAEIDDQVQGFIARQHCEISHLYLAPNARGKGMGSALLDSMKTQANTLSLWCFQANTDARRFYEHHGFGAERFTDGDDNEERLPDIRYVWRAAR